MNKSNTLNFDGVVNRKTMGVLILSFMLSVKGDVGKITDKDYEDFIESVDIDIPESACTYNSPYDNLPNLDSYTESRIRQSANRLHESLELKGPYKYATVTYENRHLGAAAFLRAIDIANGREFKRSSYINLKVRYDVSTKNFPCKEVLLKDANYLEGNWYIWLGNDGILNISDIPPGLNLTDAEKTEYRVLNQKSNLIEQNAFEIERKEKQLLESSVNLELHKVALKKAIKSGRNKNDIDILKGNIDKEISKVKKISTSLNYDYKKRKLLKSFSQDSRFASKALIDKQQEILDASNSFDKNGSRELRYNIVLKQVLKYTNNLATLKLVLDSNFEDGTNFRYLSEYCLGLGQGIIFDSDYQDLGEMILEFKKTGNANLLGRIVGNGVKNFIDKGISNKLNKLEKKLEKAFDILNKKNLEKIKLALDKLETVENIGSKLLEILGLDDDDGDEYDKTFFARIFAVLLGTGLVSYVGLQRRRKKINKKNEDSNDTEDNNESEEGEEELEEIDEIHDFSKEPKVDKTEKKVDKTEKKVDLFGYVDSNTQSNLRYCLSSLTEKSLTEDFLVSFVNNSELNKELISLKISKDMLSNISLKELIETFGRYGVKSVYFDSNIISHLEELDISSINFGSIESITIDLRITNIHQGSYLDHYKKELKKAGIINVKSIA